MHKKVNHHLFPAEGKSLGETCSHEYECSITTKNSCCGDNGVCVCNDGFVNCNSQCLPVLSLGDSCLAGSTGNCQCQNGTNLEDRECNAASMRCSCMSGLLFNSGVGGCFTTIASGSAGCDTTVATGSAVCADGGIC